MLPELINAAYGTVYLKNTVSIPPTNLGFNNWLEQRKAEGCKSISLAVLKASFENPLHFETLKQLQLISSNRIDELAFITTSSEESLLWQYSNHRESLVKTKSISNLKFFEPDADRLKYSLVQALTLNHDYALHIDNSYWSNFFQNALDSLNTIDPEISKQLPIELIDSEILFLINGIAHSQCLGGMSSWNDVYHSNTNHSIKHRKLTALLNQELHKSVIAIPKIIERALTRA